jgi:thiol-disulfide isomerase/thioredoxin
MYQATEETIKDFIAQAPRAFVKVWAENCPYCTRLDEQLNNVSLEGFTAAALQVSHPMDKNAKPSEFKRTHMRQDKSDVVKDSVPAIFVFENGELKYRHFGMLYADSLQHWLTTGEVKPSELQRIEKEQADRKQKLVNLFAQRGELTYNLDLMNAKLAEINNGIGELLK